MNHSWKFLFILVLGLSVVAPAAAENKTITYTVSCTIAPSLSLAAQLPSSPIASEPDAAPAVPFGYTPAGYGISVFSNLPDRYSMTESWIMAEAGTMKMVTLTAV